MQIILTLLAVAIVSGAFGPLPEPGPAERVPEAPALVAEPQEPTGRFTTATEVKPILSATKGSWIAVREYGGQDLLYVSHLWAWRCGLLQVEIGINGAAPEAWPLPDCHLDRPVPGVLLEEDGLPYRSFAPGSVRSVAVRIVYDDLSEDSAVFEREAVLMP